MSMAQNNYYLEFSENINSFPLQGDKIISNGNYSNIAIPFKNLLHYYRKI